MSLAAATSRPSPCLAGLLTRSSSRLGCGLAPEGERLSLALFLLCSGVRAGRPGASPGDLAPWGARTCRSKGGRSAGRARDGPQPRLPLAFSWKTKSSFAERHAEARLLDALHPDPIAEGVDGPETVVQVPRHVLHHLHPVLAHGPPPHVGGE